jgi:hypothetical protein
MQYRANFKMMQGVFHSFQATLAAHVEQAVHLGAVSRHAARQFRTAYAFPAHGPVQGSLEGCLYGNTDGKSAFFLLGKGQILPDGHTRGKGFFNGWYSIGQRLFTRVAEGGHFRQNIAGDQPCVVVVTRKGHGIFTFVHLYFLYGGKIILSGRLLMESVAGQVGRGVPQPEVFQNFLHQTGSHFPAFAVHGQLRHAVAEAYGKVSAASGMVFKNATFGRKQAFEFARIHIYTVAVVLCPVKTPLDDVSGCCNACFGK